MGRLTGVEDGFLKTDDSLRACWFADAQSAEVVGMIEKWIVANSGRFHSGRSGYGGIMSNDHSITEDVVFDLVSIQYHALQGQHLYRTFLDDASSGHHPEVEEFIRECQKEDARRANRCHELLKELTSETDTRI